MASIFGHAVLASSLSIPFTQGLNKTKLILLGIICSILPDADIIAFNFGIPYSHMFGHRGITHSIFFSLILGWLVSRLFYPSVNRSIRKSTSLYFVICTLSHAILDAMTTGGRGVAFFAPFTDERYFLPWRFIKVSPIGMDRFFTEWGAEVLKSELIYIGISSIVIFILLRSIYR